MSYYPNPYAYPQQQFNGSQQFTAQPQQIQQIQNGGFLPVRSIDEARNYPVAPGNSVTFKDDTAPYVYVKTMGFSQLDRPVFDVFRLVKEENAAQAVVAPQMTQGAEYALKADTDELRRLVEEMQKDIEQLKGAESEGE